MWCKCVNKKTIEDNNFLLTRSRRITYALDAAENDLGHFKSFLLCNNIGRIYQEWVFVQENYEKKQTNVSQF